MLQEGCVSEGLLALIRKLGEEAVYHESDLAYLVEKNYY